MLGGGLRGREEGGRGSGPPQSHSPASPPHHQTEPRMAKVEQALHHTTNPKTQPLACQMPGVTPLWTTTKPYWDYCASYPWYPV